MFLYVSKVNMSILTSETSESSISDKYSHKLELPKKAPSLKRSLSTRSRTVGGGIGVDLRLSELAFSAALDYKATN